MDKIDKFLRSLSSKDQEAMLLLQEQLKRDYRKIPGIRTLRGMKGWFRIRMGDYRIIFAVDAAKKVEIRRITRRNERTYKGL